MVFPVVMYGCESQSIKLSTEELMLLNVVWNKTLESPLDCKEIKSVNPKGFPKENQSRTLTGRTDIWKWSSNTLATWCKELTHWKRPDAGKYWRQEEKEMTEDEMVGCHHWLNGHEFEKLWEMVKDKEAWHAVVNGVAKSQAWLSQWKIT